ncbi:MAG: DUF1592 domain-containing protein [Akkermansiaceae bacterium]|nr:DUF1592 domain-containing protein [Akkermansiaceae bacterium]
MRPGIVIAAAMLAGASAGPAAPADPSAFLATYCYECHGEDKQKGDRRFDRLSFPPADGHALIAIQDIIDQLTLGEMPPKKAKKHPDDAERTAAIEAFTSIARKARETMESTGGETVLRRLNRREYLNTVSDLLAIDLTAFDPTTKFPADREAEHMDNIGDALVTSGYLLDQYLEAADALVEKSLGSTEPPEPRTWTFKGDFYQGQELDYSHKRVYKYRYLCVYEVPNTTKHEGGYAAIEKFREGVPADGFYEIKVLAHALNRDHPYDPEIFKLDPDEPFRLGIVPGDQAAGLLHHPQPIEPQLAEVTVPDGEPQWLTMTVWLNKGQTPRFIFPNGMMNCRSAFGAVARRYESHWPKSDPYKGGIVEARRIVLQHGKMPHIRIHEVRIDGPRVPWPPAAQQRFFGAEGFRPEQSRAILERFADRAYRRPATTAEVDRLMAVVEARKAKGHAPRQAVLDAMKTILCSPAFLYLAEPAGGKGGQGDGAGALLGPHDLASRLSYFLWATMPDDELRGLADRGEITQPAVLAGQLERLLDDPRSDEFIAGFLDSWLNLRALGDMPPDRDTFGIYYAKNLQNAMKRETSLFTRHLLDTNGPITDFLDAGYTFVNKPLARHYGLDAEFETGKAHEFRRVEITDRRRGGLLGMGGVLTVTANGIETSPVTRGVWILENILGTPPAPPPDDVPPIDPDIRGATTIRDQLKKHRDSPACYDCHRKIDPPGFALEGFDPIGAWRTHYPMGRRQGPRIDTSGELGNGRWFRDVVEFKELLADRKDFFARMLAERLLTYATGRRVEPLDRPDVDRIVRELADADHGMRTLLEKVVTSPVFRSR